MTLMEAYRLNRLPRNCAMRERTHWFFVIAILSFLGTSVVAPALARGGVNTGMVGFRSGFAMHTARPSMRSRVVMRHIFARHADVQNDLRFRRRTPLQNGLPITNWPYSPYTDTAPMDVPLTQSEVLPSPPVILMSGLSSGGLDRTGPETRPDFSYVAGCHAIPNGYHCNTPHKEAVAP
jgi:hypothetical protein